MKKKTLNFNTIDPKPLKNTLSSLNLTPRSLISLPCPHNLSPPCSQPTHKPHASQPPSSIGKLSLSHRSSLSFSLINPLSICRNCFSVRAIFSEEDSSTAPIKTHFRYASIFPQSLFIPIETHVKFCSCGGELMMVLIEFVAAVETSMVLSKLQRDFHKQREGV